MAKDEYIDVQDIELIEEVHDRIDTLVDLLKEKGIIAKGEFDARLTKNQEKKYI